MTALPFGTLLHGRFKISSVLGEGPLGSIYLVLDTKITGRLLSAREFLPLPATSEERLEAEKSFQQQIQIIKPLRHPNLIEVWESFVEFDRIYLITEYVEGLSLEALSQITKDSIPENDILEWGVQACDALKYLHDVTPPFYMKDLSPRALVVDRDKKLKIGAYGLHLIFTPPKEIPHSFLAPEFRATGEGTKAADVYSLAATFFFLLTRQIPEQPIRPATIFNPKVSNNLSLALHQCLHPDPKQRLAEISELRETFYEMLHSREATSLSPPRVTFKSVFTRKFSRVLTTLVSWSLEAAKRPYYVILVALIWWVLHLTYLAPSHQAFKKTGPLLYAACAEEIAILDPFTLQVAGRIATPESRPVSFLSADGKTMWLASGGGTIQGFNVNTNQTAAKFSVGQSVGGLTKSRSGMLLASLDQGNIIATLAEATGKVISIIPVGEKPQDLVYENSNNELYVLDAKTGNVEIVNPAKGMVTQILNFDSPVSHMIGSADGKYIYLSFNSQEEIQVLDSDQGTMVTSLKLRAPGPYRMTSSEGLLVVTAYEGSRIWAYEPGTWVRKGEWTAEKPNVASVSPDGKRLFVANEAGVLLAFNTSTGKLEGRVKVGKDPSFLFFIP